jgi:hypothetical protein
MLKDGDPSHRIGGGTDYQSVATELTKATERCSWPKGKKIFDEKWNPRAGRRSCLVYFWSRTSPLGINLSLIKCRF